MAFFFCPGYNPQAKVNICLSFSVSPPVSPPQSVCPSSIPAFHGIGSRQASPFPHTMSVLLHSSSFLSPHIFLPFLPFQPHTLSWAPVVPQPRRHRQGQVQVVWHKAGAEGCAAGMLPAAVWRARGFFFLFYFIGEVGKRAPGPACGSQEEA